MILHGDCLEAMKTLPDNYVEAVVTDPPAGISFMQKSWDSDKGGRDQWIKWLSEIMLEAKRVLKPGGHAFVWALPRTSHWTGMALEDAGFEVRDCVYHLFGSGFPKNHDVSKAIDKAAGVEREVTKQGERKIGQPGEFDARCSSTRERRDDPATEAAKQWQGWGTSLKPAAECWWLCRKPLEKGLTVAENVQKWGTGALNIDASRIECEPFTTVSGGKAMNGGKFGDNESEREARYEVVTNTKGRWPANIILDEEAAKVLDEQSGERKSGAMKSVKSNSLGFHGGGSGAEWNVEASSGGASRFFYVAKSSKRDRNSDGVVSNVHPTCKPTKLMEYLIRMITPPTGIVLDPFAGSGTTGVAAKRLGFGFIGIEREKEYCEIAEKRMEAV